MDLRIVIYVVVILYCIIQDVVYHYNHAIMLPFSCITMHNFISPLPFFLDNNAFSPVQNIYAYAWYALPGHLVRIPKGKRKRSAGRVSPISTAKKQKAPILLLMVLILFTWGALMVCHLTIKG